MPFSLLSMERFFWFQSSVFIVFCFRYYGYSNRFGVVIVCVTLPLCRQSLLLSPFLHQSTLYYNTAIFYCRCVCVCLYVSFHKNNKKLRNIKNFTTTTTIIYYFSKQQLCTLRLSMQPDEITQTQQVISIHSTIRHLLRRDFEETTHSCIFPV